MTERFDRDNLIPEELLSDLLKEHFATCLPEHLQKRIDQELVLALKNKAESKKTSANGQASANDKTSVIDRKAASIQHSSQGKATLWRRPLFRFLGFAAATVACWMILFSGLGKRNHTWAAVVEALEREPWWEIVSDGESEPHGWLSIPARIVVVSGDRPRTNKSVWRDGLRSIYVAAKKAIYQDSVHRDRSMSQEGFVKASLLRLILGHAADDELEGWRVIEESSNLTDAVVELRIRFEHAQSMQSFTVIIGIDERTQYPMWMHVMESNGTTKQLVNFVHAVKGPTSIYELGIPRDTEVVEGLANSAPNDTNIIADKAQSTRSEVTDVEQDPLFENANNKKLGLSRTASSVDAVLPSEMAQRIDELLDEKWKSLGLTPAEPATDSEFLRRIYLDLTGRIPSIAEIRRFEKQSMNERRTGWVNELLNSRDYANHFGAVWRAILLPSEADLANVGGTSELDAWLADQFRDNVPYDEVVEKLLLAEGRVNETGPLLFFAAAKMNPEEIATQTSRAFLGTRMECAQCHDHPFDHWTQEEFWGLAAYFARISRPQGELEMVSPVLRVADSDWGEVKLPDSEKIVSPQLPFPLADLAFENSSSKEGLQQVSRRKQFVDWLTAPSNTQFSKAAVNRVWAHLFGRGLVDPVDDMGSHNPAVCPNVLDELTTYFTQTGFDLSQLIATLIQTKAYQLSSRSLDDKPARTAVFAQMNIKSFTAEQLYDSIVIATLRQQNRMNANFPDQTRSSFLKAFRVPPGSRTDYQSGIPQALMLINGSLVSESTVESGELIQSLQAPFFSDEQRIEMLFLATLSRKPSDLEFEQMRFFLANAEDDSVMKQRLSDMLWALLNSAEFTLNH